MANKTTRKSKLNNKHIETRIELAKHSKKLSNKVLKKYFILALPIFLIELIILLSMLATSNEIGKIIGIVLICTDALITFTYFVIFDAIPTKKVKKEKDKLKNKLSLNQIKVFYITLKTQTIIRTIANIFMTSLITILTIILYVI